MLRFLRAWVVVGGASWALGSLGGCKPETPTVVVTSAEFVSLSPVSLALRLHLTATNPNGYDVTIRSLDARVVTQGRPLGNVSLPQETVLPSHQTVPVQADLSLPLTALEELGRIALGGPVVPYHVEGTVTAGTFFFTVPVPFQKDGSVTRQELLSHLGAKLPVPILGK